ncbi:MAG: type III restriction endonuclease subunit R, partial [Patescibacteria group bacterium]|nr:type III restriction endonuclease subunit R [Patescibacteria group bacterium]
EIPRLTPRIYREYKNLSELDPSSFGNEKFAVKQYSEEEKREIIFKFVGETEDKKKEIHHVTVLGRNLFADYRSVIRYFTQIIMKELRLISGGDILYGKIKEFIRDNLFEEKVNLEDLNTLRSLSEVEVSRTVIESFKRAINNLTILDKGEAEICEWIKISKARPFVARDQSYIVPKKSVFNRIVGDSNFELEMASFFERCPDIISYAKNYESIHFKIDYRNADGTIANYFPDFLVKAIENEVYIVETKGREDLDDHLKIKRLRQWCEDVNRLQSKIRYHMLYVKQEEFGKYHPESFRELVRLFGG